MSSSPFASQLCAPEGPTAGPDGWILNVCSFTRDVSWASRGGDILATHPNRPGETVRVLNTSTGGPGKGPPGGGINYGGSDGGGRDHEGRDHGGIDDEGIDHEGIEGIEGIPAALAFGPDGALYITDEGHRAILRIGPDGARSRWLDSYRGEPINGPNDLVFDADGACYFTDPWGSSLEAQIGAVYGYDPTGNDLHRIDEAMAFPNGIVLRDGRLYAAETLRRSVWVYDVVAPGRATGKRLFCRQPDAPAAPVCGPDGMAFDAEGNLLVTHYGSGHVYVYDSDGAEVDRIATGGANPTNVCFAGTDHATLFITVDDTGEMVTVDWATPGRRLHFCPSATDNHPFAAMLRAAEPLNPQPGGSPA